MHAQLLIALIFLIGAATGAAAVLLFRYLRNLDLPSSRARQSGNIFFVLFGAVGLVGVLGAATTTVLKGPVAGMQKVTKYTVAENAMIAAGRLSIVEAREDCDSDDVMEPLAWADAGANPHPAGGGLIPSTVGSAKQDPWGNTFGYCAWDHGAEVAHAGCGGAGQSRLGGDTDIEDDAGGIVLAVISSGPDRIFQTSCAAHPGYVTKGGDDIVLEYTYGEAQSLAGGLWTPKGESGAEIARDLEVYSAASPTTQIFGVDSSTDPAKPSIKVDFIQKLSDAASGVTVLSPVRIEGPSTVGLTIKSPGGADGTRAGIHFNDSANNLTGYLGVAAADDYMWASSNNSGMRIATTDAHPIVFHTDRAGAGGTAPSERMRISPTGNVGIGTTDPQAKLHVAHGTGSLLANFSTSAANLMFYEDADFPGFLSLRSQSGNGIIIQGAADVPSIVVKRDTSNVGIGTNDPQAKLHVGGPVYVDYPFHGPSITMRSRPASALYPNIEDNWEIYPAGINAGSVESRLSFASRNDATQVPTAHLSILSNGNIGMGTVDPQQRLIVSTNVADLQVVRIENTNAAATARAFTISQTGSSGDVFGAFSGGGQARMLIRGNGNVEIPSGTLNMSTNKIIGLGTPTAGTDAATKAYVDSVAGGGGAVPTCANGQVMIWSGGAWACNNGSGLANLNASALASGTVPAARMGSGTTNATTYLRGDNTWQPISGIGSGAYLPLSGGTMGADAVIQFGSQAGDKVRWYSNTYGTGIESATLTHWSGGQHRWRIGGTSVSTGFERMLLTNTGLTVFGSVTATAFSGSDASLTGQITGGFGAQTTVGTLDWNHVSNARSGSGYTLLRGTDSANAPSASSNYFHPFSFEYSSKTGAGNLTQFAIPYHSGGLPEGMFMRSRYNGTWSGWHRFPVETPAGNLTVTGTVTAATPTAPGHLATKAYVDANSGGGGARIAPKLRQIVPSMPLAPDGNEWADMIFCPNGANSAVAFTLELYNHVGAGNNQVGYVWAAEGVYYNKTTGARGDTGSGAAGCAMNYVNAIKG